MLQNLNGANITVIGPNLSGWYEIEINGTRGWLFGAFITPNDPGLTAAITRSNGEATLRDSSGFPTGRPNESGNKVLLLSTTGSLWSVLLPDGSTAFVNGDEFTVLG